jgi:hypothetical protein
MPWGGKQTLSKNHQIQFVNTCPLDTSLTMVWMASKEKQKEFEAFGANPLAAPIVLTLGQVFKEMDKQNWFKAKTIWCEKVLGFEDCISRKEAINLWGAIPDVLFDKFKYSSRGSNVSNEFSSSFISVSFIKRETCNNGHKWISTSKSIEIPRYVYILYIRKK